MFHIIITIHYIWFFNLHTLKPRIPKAIMEPLVIGLSSEIVIVTKQLISIRLASLESQACFQDGN